MTPPGKTPLVSIITPTLNSERFIESNLRSILSQTYPRIEHIIIDGRSDDRTLSIIRDLSPKARVLSEPDNGISDAFNKGLRLASGDIIAILNSDDYYAHPDVIRRVVHAFTRDQEIGLLYGKVSCVDMETGSPLAVYGEPFSLRKMKQAIITPHPAVFAKKEVYDAIGAFSLEYKVAMDHDYFLRAVKKFTPFFFNEVLTVMRWGGFSTKNIFLSHRESYRMLLLNGEGRAFALAMLVYKYFMTSISLLLQKCGLRRLVLFYRRTTGQL
jgi:glycosyltransferase involved in cell wall biosynthesis